MNVYEVRIEGEKPFLVQGATISGVVEALTRHGYGSCVVAWVWIPKVGELPRREVLSS